MRITRLSVSILLWTCLLIGSSTTQLVGQTIRIRIGTIVPKDSPWHETLKYIAQDWRRISGGMLDVRIYPGGVLGDETDMVRQVRSGRIQAVGLSSIGLSHIDTGVSCLQVPMMFDSYDELDYVRDRIASQLERRIEARGFKVLNWADGGWVRTFSKAPARTPDDVRKMKLFTSSGDAETEKLYKELRFQVIPLSFTDMLTSLQTGMIDAVNLPPLFALLNGSYRLAPNMIDVKWTPMVGGTVISKRVWNRIPEQYRPQMLRTARDAGHRLRREIRKMGTDAILEMGKRGLNVIKPNAALWQSEAEEAYPKLRGRYCPADIFDDVQRLRDEFRGRHAPRSAQE